MRTMLWIAMASLACGVGHASGQTAEKTLSLKGGETAEVGTAYFITNCRSLLKSDPTIDIMEAPDGVNVTLRKEQVTPRSSNCSKPVRGGTLVVAAPATVKARTEGRLTIRVNYDTLDGKRQSTREFNLILFP